MKFCPGCRRVVETVQVPVSQALDVVKCSSCGRVLAQVAAGQVLWFPS